MKILFWLSGAKDPSPRFRFIQFVDGLNKLGHTVDVCYCAPDRYQKINVDNPILRRFIGLLRSLKQYFNARQQLKNAHNYDIVYTNKDILPSLRNWGIEAWLKNRGARLVFDIDDAIYLGHRGEKLNKILPYYTAVIAGSPVLKEYVKDRYKLPSYYIPMAINTNFYQRANDRKPGKLRIGWSGSHHTVVYALPLLEKPLRELAKTVEFEFLIISNRDPEITWEGIDMRYLPWSEEKEVKYLQYFDIGLMPLMDGEFERGKCALKAVQYMALGIPALVSPVGVNSLIVRDGIDGYHCESINDFTEKLALLSQDKALRLQLGGNAYQRVHENYTVEVLLREYDRIFHQILQLT